MDASWCRLGCNPFQNWFKGNSLGKTIFWGQNHGFLSGLCVRFTVTHALAHQTPGVVCYDNQQADMLENLFDAMERRGPGASEAT